MREVEKLSVLITGGGSGIGAATAAHFVERGARVTISGRRREPLEGTAARLGALCHPCVGDVTVAGDRERMIAAAVTHGGRLDVLVNNAGNMYRGPIDTLDETALLALFHSNVVAGMLLAGLAKAQLEGGGSIIFIGSVHNRRAFPGASPYAATKGAVEALTKVLAAELGGDGIRVNCVVPGAVFTEINQRAGLFDDEEARQRLERMASMHALGRIGSAEEIAEAIEYLVCAEWTTGAVLDVDGGLGLGLTSE